MKSIRWTTVLAAFLLLGSSATFSQTTTHELGLRLFGLDDFDFVYKKSKDENRFTRFRLAVFDFGFNNINIDNEDRSTSSFNVGLAIGTERRKEIKENFYFIHGFEPILGVGISNDIQDETRLGLNLGIGYILGFQHDISEKFYANIELIPAISTFYQTNFDEFNEFRVNTQLRSNAIALSLVYRFTTTQED